MKKRSWHLLSDWSVLGGTLITTAGGGVILRITIKSSIPSSIGFSKPLSKTGETHMTTSSFEVEEK